ncbi:hypothetical protein ACXR6G_04900 [Ancylomarina sp. YFZ004]
MNYRFDTIESRWTVALVTFSLMLFPFIPFAILNVRVWFPIPPSIFISFGIPMLLSASISLLIARNKQQLFWTKMSLSIDEQNLVIKINQKEYSLNNLEYYYISFGSYLSSGTERKELYLKFEGEKGKTIMACKSSQEIEHYDRFCKKFDHIIVEYKLKPFGFKRLFKPIIYIFTIVSIAVFPITYFIDGPKIAFKLLPLYLILAILIIFIAGMRYLIKKT